MICFITPNPKLFMIYFQLFSEVVPGFKKTMNSCFFSAIAASSNHQINLFLRQLLKGNRVISDTLPIQKSIGIMYSRAR